MLDWVVGAWMGGMELLSILTVWWRWFEYCIVFDTTSLFAYSYTIHTHNTKWQWKLLICSAAATVDRLELKEASRRIFGIETRLLILIGEPFPTIVLFLIERGIV